MVGIGIYNIIVSTILIIVSIFFIKQINKDIKKNEGYKKYTFNSTNKVIKIGNIIKVFSYVVIVVCFICIIFTLFIFTIKF